MLRILFLSFAAHLALMALLFAPWFWRTKPTADLLFLDLPTPPAVSASSTLASKRARESRGNLKEANPKSIPQALSLAPSPHSFSYGKSGPSRSGPPSRGSAVSDFADRMDLAQEGKFYPLAERIWKSINDNLTYPIDIVEENVQGTVLLHVLVNEHGKFSGTFLEVDGEPLLSSYAMAIVAYALREEIPFPPSEAANPKAEIPLAIRIDFKLLPYGAEEVRYAKAHFRNSLAFERIAHTDPQWAKAVRRFQGEFPIVPVPGGFFIDFVALYQRMKPLQDRDPRIKRAFRLEMDQEHWRQVVKKSNPAEV